MFIETSAKHIQLLGYLDEGIQMNKERQENKKKKVQEHNVVNLHVIICPYCVDSWWGCITKETEKYMIFVIGLSWLWTAYVEMDKKLLWNALTWNKW